ncbi:Glycerol-3-phosphate dehydrogenase/oxidase [Sulfidibacter corallicola]|uniref:Glycerol-3-phosphate dehydrogenase/oxidase n=1 Tax=Sulfidibacter corallicola TaxID=2818388 RepID=A0A8A4TKB3_SULCO|nr:glycerol-3-phosphate dehydrogenase/oxidase [Sulfidibacter corallicola]QTD49268.1 glycerol-3-phosphate dehydrogenase/oxidase [Sulfidibacter corallicola]
MSEHQHGNTEPSPSGGCEAWNASWRSRFWGELASDEHPVWDLIIIGGGITGAGIMREAVRMGLKVLLVEQRDFSWGTSSRSSKLVHGGLRYLKEGHIMLTRDAIHERQRLLKESQTLVQPLKFLISNYKGQKPGKWTFRAGLTLYDLLAAKMDHEVFDAETFKMMVPHLDPEGLQGGLRYDDAQTDDSRLVLRLVFESMALGGSALNYVRAEKPFFEDDRVAGVVLHDLIHGGSARLRARVVVNATGAWADHLRRTEEKRLRPLRGSHLVFPAWRLPAPQAMTILHPRDRRPVFLLPWEGASVLGTTDVDHRQDLDEEASVTADEVDYLMEVVQARFPRLNLTVDDVIASWSGVRPVISHGAKDPSKESRDHAIWDENGLLTITGGKLTTFRKMAFDLLQKAKKYLGDDVHIDKHPPVFRQDEPDWKALPPLEAPIRNRLLGRYGLAAGALIRCAGPDELRTIPGTETLWVELRWTARSEQVAHLDDLLLRRTRIGLLLAEGGRDILPRIREIVQIELDWDDARWEKEEAAYLEIWRRHYSLPPEMIERAASDEATEPEDREATPPVVPHE